MADGPATKLDEVEITPEMIEAGAAELDSWDGGYMEPPDWAVERVFRAMNTARVAVSSRRRFQAPK